MRPSRASLGALTRRRVRFEAVPVAPAEPEAVPQLEAEPASQAETADDVADTVPEPRLNLVQKMREWLRRAA